MCGPYIPKKLRFRWQLLYRGVFYFHESRISLMHAFALLEVPFTAIKYTNITTAYCKRTCRQLADTVKSRN